MLATLGIVERARSSAQPRVAIVSTGDELVDAGDDPGRGQVRDSNRWAHRRVARSRWAACPSSGPVALDTAEALAEALRTALDVADAVVLTGGSSVGVRDLTPRVIDGLGKPGVIVHGLRVKPGKPTVFAMLDGKPVIGLPGQSGLLVDDPRSGRRADLLAPGRRGGSPACRDRGGRGTAVHGPRRLDVVRARSDPARRRAHLAAPLTLRSAHTSLLARAHGYVVVGPRAVVDRRRRTGRGASLQLGRPDRLTAGGSRTRNERRCDMSVHPQPAAAIRAVPATTPFVAPEELARRVGESSLVRLGANESAFGPSPKAIAAMQAAVPLTSFYGDPESIDLRTALAARHGCKVENIIVGSGVDELLGLICRTYGNARRSGADVARQLRDLRLPRARDTGSS